MKRVRPGRGASTAPDRASGEPGEADTTVDAGAASRADLLRRALVAGGAVATGGLLAAGLPKLAASAPSRRQDERILNFALELEYLLAAFYGDAAERGELDGELRRLAQIVGEQERAHVAFLRKALGGDARDEPAFDFGDATADRDRFLQSALLLEETTVSAYIGQGANLTRRRMIPFGRITSVEGRHAAWIRDLLGKNAAPLAADSAKTPKQVEAAIRKTGFVASE